MSWRTRMRAVAFASMTGEMLAAVAQSDQLKGRHAVGRRRVNLSATVRQARELVGLARQLPRKALRARARVKGEHPPAEVHVPHSASGYNGYSDSRLALLAWTLPRQREAGRIVRHLERHYFASTRQVEHWRGVRGRAKHASATGWNRTGEHLTPNTAEVPNSQQIAFAVLTRLEDQALVLEQRRWNGTYISIGPIE